MAQKLVPVEKLNRGVAENDLAALATTVTDATLTWNNTGDQILMLFNTDTAPVVATLVATPDPFGRGGGAVNDEVATIPLAGAGGTKVGMFPFASPSMFNDGQIATVTLSSITALKALLITQRKS